MHKILGFTSVFWVNLHYPLLNLVEMAGREDENSHGSVGCCGDYEDRR